MRLIATGSDARDAWQAALIADAQAVVFQTPAWLDCICAVGRHQDATRAYEAADGRRLILPLARFRGLPPRAGAASSMPWGWGTGGIVCAGDPASVQELQSISADLCACPRLWTAVRPGPTADDAWAAAVPRRVARTRHMVQIVELAGGFEAVWKRFSGSVRRACAKAERSGLDVEWDDTGRLVGVFDSLYRKSVARWSQHQLGGAFAGQMRASLREPRRKYEIVAERLGAACRVWVAWRSGEPAAALIVLTHGEHSTYWRGAMDTEVEAGTRANDLLHRLAIEDACRAGRRLYHMGESAPGSPLARFKRGFGAEERRYTSYRFERVPLTHATRCAHRHTAKILLRARRP